MNLYQVDVQILRGHYYLETLFGELLEVVRSLFYSFREDLVMVISSSTSAESIPTLKNRE